MKGTKRALVKMEMKGKDKKKVGEKRNAKKENGKYAVIENGRKGEGRRILRGEKYRRQKIEQTIEGGKKGDKKRKEKEKPEAKKRLKESQWEDGKRIGEEVKEMKG